MSILEMDFERILDVTFFIVAHTPYAGSLFYLFNNANVQIQLFSFSFQRLKHQ